MQSLKRKTSPLFNTLKKAFFFFIFSKQPEKDKPRNSWKSTENIRVTKSHLKTFKII